MCFSRSSFEMIKVLYIPVHARLQTITFSHDTISGSFDKWDDTISGTTCGWKNPGASERALCWILRSPAMRIRTECGKSFDRKPSKHWRKIDEKSTENRANIDRNSTSNVDRWFSRSSYEIITIFQMTVHARLQTITFSHDTISGSFDKWDDTISGTTCGWTNPGEQSGLMMVPVNTSAIMRTEYGQNIDRKPSKHRQNIDEKSTENRANIDRKSTANWQMFLEVELWNDYSIKHYCTHSVTNYYIQSWYNKWDFW